MSQWTRFKTHKMLTRRPYNYFNGLLVLFYCIYCFGFSFSLLFIVTLWELHKYSLIYFTANKSKYSTCLSLIWQITVTLANDSKDNKLTYVLLHISPSVTYVKLYAFSNTIISAGLILNKTLGNHTFGRPFLRSQSIQKYSTY